MLNVCKTIDPAEYVHTERHNYDKTHFALQMLASFATYKPVWVIRMTVCDPNGCTLQHASRISSDRRLPEDYPDLYSRGCDCRDRVGRTDVRTTPSGDLYTAVPNLMTEGRFKRSKAVAIFTRLITPYSSPSEQSEIKSGKTARTQS